MKIFLAPIRGITDYVYREAFSAHFGGVDAAVTPFINSVQGRKIKSSYLRDILPNNNERTAIVPQILSKDADDFLFIAERVFDLGYNEVNWNLGCPTPMVANKQRGSGLLPFPEQIETVLEKVCQKYPDKIAVKTRLGRHNPREIEVVLPILNKYPLKRVIIHPRLGVQMYKGIADLDAFAACVPLCRHKLVYNGDIVDVAGFKHLRERFGDKVDAWMIGRGLLANPLLARMIRGENITVSANRFLDFHDEVFQHYKAILAGPGHLLGRMKGFWCYYAGIFANSRGCLKKITKAKGIENYLAAVKKIFAEEKLMLL